MSNKISNTSIEKYIIKVLFNSPASGVEVFQNLRKNDFTHPAYQHLFVAIKHTSINGQTSAESIMSYLEIKNRDGYEYFKKIGGAYKIEQILKDDSLNGCLSVKEQIRELQELSYRRNVLQTANKMIAYAETGMDVDTNINFGNIEEMDEKIKENIYGLTETINHDTNVEMIGNGIDDFRKEIASGEALGISFDFVFPKLNKIFKGLKNGSLISIGAPPKCGKSTFLLHLAVNIAMQGIPVALADTEMAQWEVLARICSKLSGIAEDRIVDNLLTEKEQKIVDATWTRMKTLPIYYFNANDLTVNELENKVKLLQMQKGIQIFFYDYCKIMAHQAESGRPDLIIAQRLDTLKERIAKQCDIPVITAGQVYEKSDPRGASNKFAESNHFYKLSDIVVRLDRCDPNDPEDLDSMGTHYIEIILGRKINIEHYGKKIYYNFNMPTHQVVEL